MPFKKLRSVRLPYDEQAYIHYLCRTYNLRPESTQKRIRALCDEIGGEYADILFLVMTTHKGVRRISCDRHLSESVIYEMRKRFYERFKEDS